MKTLPLTAGQQEFQRLGKLRTSIDGSRKAAEARTKIYYARLMEAVEKGDTVKIETLHQEHKQGEKGVIASLREQQAYIADKWREAADKIIPPAATK